MRKIYSLIALVILSACKGEPVDSIAPHYLYKVTSPELWEKSQGSDVLLLTDHDEEFIHLSREDQLERIVEKFWKSHSKPYVVLKLETKLLPGDLRFEANQPGGNKYYHLYAGKIPLSAVVEVK